MSDVFVNLSPESGESQPLKGEKPLAESSYHVCGESQRKFQRKAQIEMIVAVTVGAFLTLAYILLTTLNGETIGGELFTVSETLLYVLFVCGVFALSGGIVLLIALRKNIVSAERTDAENHYCFFPDYVLITVTRNGECTEQSKSYYRTFVKVRENRDYFMLYPTATTVLPVIKSTLTEEEREKLRGILPLKN